MRKRWRGAIGAAAFVGMSLLAGCGGGGAGGGAGEASARVEEGRKLYRGSCATCHGMAGEGMSRLGADLRGNRFIAEHDDASLVEFLIVGRRASDPANSRGIDMPPRGGNPALTDDHLAAIVAYLRSLQ